MDISKKSYPIHAINEKIKLLFKHEFELTRMRLREMAEPFKNQPNVIMFEAGN